MTAAATAPERAALPLFREPWVLHSHRASLLEEARNATDQRARANAERLVRLTELELEIVEKLQELAKARASKPEPEVW